MKNSCSNLDCRRWWIVVGALMIQICLGALYAWSIFVPPLKESFGFTATQTQAIFSVAIAVFALVMIFAGRWQDKAGPRKVALTGGIILGIGYLLAGTLPISFWSLLFLIGVVGGAGIGFAYVCPLAASVKWFPDKKGLIIGLSVAGFGGGAFFFVKLAGVWGNLMATYGVSGTMKIFGLIFLLFVVIGAMLLKNPPAGYVPKGYKSITVATKENGIHDWDWKEMIKTRQFWMLWSLFFIGGAAGLLVIGILKHFGKDAFVRFLSMEPTAAAAAAGTALGFLALANGLGRITWGTVSDKLGYSKSIALMNLLQGIMMLFVAFIVFKEWMPVWMLGIIGCWVGFNFGGNFALFPTSTAGYFGAKNVGANYAWVFTSYGVGGIAGPILAGKVFDVTGSYMWAFIPAGILCLIAVGIAMSLTRPEKDEPVVKKAPKKVNKKPVKKKKVKKKK